MARASEAGILLATVSQMSLLLVVLVLTTM